MNTVAGFQIGTEGLLLVGLEAESVGETVGGLDIDSGVGPMTESEKVDKPPKNNQDEEDSEKDGASKPSSTLRAGDAMPVRRAIEVAPIANLSAVVQNPTGGRHGNRKDEQKAHDNSRKFSASTKAVGAQTAEKKPSSDQGANGAVISPHVRRFDLTSLDNGVVSGCAAAAAKSL
jgi:hypothetical protein